MGFICFKVRPIPLKVVIDVDFSQVDGSSYIARITKFQIKVITGNIHLTFRKRAVPINIQIENNLLGPVARRDKFVFKKAKAIGTFPLDLN